MKLLLLLLVLIPEILARKSGVREAASDHAQFEWTDCGENVADQCLMVLFPADNTADIALLNYVDGEVTVLSGHLKDDESIAISVTVEEHQLEVTMHSPHDDDHSMYIVNLDTGATEVVSIPDDVIFDHPLEVPGGYNASAGVGFHKRNIERRFVPSNGYNLRVAVFYDTNFQTFAGGQAGAETKLTSIFNHVKTLYTQFTVSGVSGAIKPSLHSLNYRSGSWSADSSLRTCSYISNNLQWDVDEHVYVTYQGSASGIVGMAWVGTTCSIYQFYRSNINEWFRTDTITAQIIAHEIGHNLGMFHDFTNSRGNRYENGQLCTNVGGYMDYTQTPTKWSDCSVGDFTRYYNFVNSRRPNDGVRPSSPFCLQESTDTGGNTPAQTCVEKCVAEWTATGTPACVKTASCTTACTAGTCTA